MIFWTAWFCLLFSLLVVLVRFSKGMSCGSGEEWHQYILGALESSFSEKNWGSWWAPNWTWASRSPFQHRRPLPAGWTRWSFPPAQGCWDMSVVLWPVLHFPSWESCGALAWSRKLWGHLNYKYRYLFDYYQTYWEKKGKKGIKEKKGKKKTV